MTDISKLTNKEIEAINLFKIKIFEKFPEDINKIIIFGSKARGNADKNSDIDIMIEIKSKDWKKADKIREIGYELDSDIEYKFSIRVVSQDHIKYLKQNNFQFIQNIERDGITI